MNGTKDNQISVMVSSGIVENYVINEEVLKVLPVGNYLNCEVVRN